MKIEEARKISADFKSTNFVAPPRSASDMKNYFNASYAVSDDCPRKITARWEKMKRIRDRAASITIERGMGLELERELRQNVVHAGYEVEFLMSIGRFELAIELLRDILEPFEGTESFPVTRSEIVSRLARIYARLGD